MIFYQLLRPLAYLKIDHPEKYKFDWLIPLIATSISMAVIIPLLDLINIYGSFGLIDKTSSFIQTLPGFYIAALAAIATFNRQDIDKHIPAPTPKIEILIAGQKNIISLTRRRFLCMLFAFLTAESIFIAIFGMAAMTLAPAFSHLIQPNFHLISTCIVLSIFIFLFWQLITSTCLGLYYLGDRLHQPETN